jgi:hypothetical protein
MGKIEKIPDEEPTRPTQDPELHERAGCGNITVEQVKPRKRGVDPEHACKVCGADSPRLVA